MNIYGGYDPSVDIVGGAFGVVLGVYLFILLLALAAGVVFYVLQSISLYTIAKRRGIRNPWLAWIPVGCNWILGSIADQYQYVKQGKVKNRRKILLGLSLASVICAVLYFVVTFAITMAAAFTAVGESAGVVMVTLLYYLVTMGISVTTYVFLYISLHDLYASCDPSNTVLFLLLSIFVNVTMPFFLFACRNKDGGMPPRRDAVVSQPAGPQPHPDWVAAHGNNTPVPPAPVPVAPVEDAAPAVPPAPENEETDSAAPAEDQ